MSFYTASAEIGEGAHIQVRIGSEDWPERIIDMTVTGIQLDQPQAVILCEITGEVPQQLLEQIRNPAPSEPSPKWWRRSRVRRQ